MSARNCLSCRYSLTEVYFVSNEEFPIGLTTCKLWRYPFKEETYYRPCTDEELKNGCERYKKDEV